MSIDIYNKVIDAVEDLRELLLEAAEKTPVRESYANGVGGARIILLEDEIVGIINLFSNMCNSVLKNNKCERWPALNDFTAEQLAEHLVELIHPNDPKYDLSFGTSLFGYWETPDGKKFDYHKKDDAIDHTIKWLNGYVTFDEL